MNSSQDILIVGAGPYGFGLADELWTRGCGPLVVGEPFATWHRHTLDSMNLRSDPRASEVYSPSNRYALPDVRGRDPEADRLSIHPFREYLRQVEAEAPFPILRDRVVELQRRSDYFVTTLAGGDRIEARSVVLATGAGSHLHVPPELRRLPAERVVHSWQSREIQTWSGQNVLVVGAGQSGAEVVDLLRRANRVTWAVRREPMFFREPLRLPTPLFKIVVAAAGTYFRMPPAVQRTLGSLCFRTTVTPHLRRAWESPEVHRVVADVRALELGADEDRGIRSRKTADRYDRVVAATGFRYSVDGFPFLSSELRARLGNDHPLRLSRDFESVVPGLYLAGGVAEGMFGPAMRFIIGSRHTARQLGAALSRRSGRDSARASTARR